MNVLRKRGLSPVVATVLLVAITLVLAVIIFIWARTFIGENIQKQGIEISQLCEDVNFKADAYGTPLTLYIENVGSVPLDGVEIRKKAALGDISYAERVPSSLTAGQTASFPITNPDIEIGNEIFVVPILLGETATETKSHVCDEDYALEIVVGG